MKSDAWVDLGRGCAVRAGEVAYIHAGEPPTQMQFPLWFPAEVKCVIWLKDGTAMPAYEPATTIIRRLDAVANAEAREEIAEAYNRGYNSGYVAGNRKAEKASAA